PPMGCLCCSAATRAVPAPVRPATSSATRTCRPSARRTRGARSRWPTPGRARTAGSSSSCTRTATSRPTTRSSAPWCPGWTCSTASPPAAPTTGPWTAIRSWPCTSTRSRSADALGLGPAHELGDRLVVLEGPALEPHLLEVPPRLPDERPGRDAQKLHDRVAVEVGPDPRQVLLGLQP